MRGRLLAWLCASALAAGGCRSKEERTYRGQVLVGKERALVELGAGTLASLSMSDGAIDWRYQPTRAASPYVDFSERYRLVCPVLSTPAGDLLLRYGDELHVISQAEGKLRWKRRVNRWAGGRRRCPAAAPDGGIVLLGRKGLLVRKLNRDGSPGWTYPLAAVGAAVSPPQVSEHTGDVVIRTASHLVSLGPAGALNWAQPRRERRGTGRR